MTKLKGLVIVPKGIEDVAALEIKEILKAEPKIMEMCLSFEVKTLVELCKFCYASQSAARVLVLMDEFQIPANYEEACNIIEPRLKKLDLKGWIAKDMKFKVECRREGKHDFTSQALAEWMADKFGEKLKAELGLELKADLKEPNVIFYVLIVGEKMYVGIDLAGYDLSKRDYKIMSHMPSIKANIGYALLRIADYEGKGSLLDVSSYSGVIPIEAALFASKKPVNFYRKQELLFRQLPATADIDFEKFFADIDGKAKEDSAGEIICMNNQHRFISAAKTNSKIAGVNKLISFSRFDIEWLDTKFQKASIDLIASNSPRISKTNEAGMAKFYTELFYQANYVLKRNGRIGLLTNSLDAVKAAAAKNNFTLVSERAVWQGEEELRIGVFVRV